MICIFRHNDVVTHFLQYINDPNQEHKRSNRPSEGANPSWQYPYDRRHDGMAAATWL